MQTVSPLPFTPRPLSGNATDADPAITLLGPSLAMAQLWANVRRLAPHVRTVLLTGSPDSGQEAVARLLLDLSPFPRRNFLTVGAAEVEGDPLRPAVFHTLPPDLLLFLPEVHRLSGPGQNSLLRLLRSRRTRLSSFVAATSEDLRALVSMGRFSAELADALGAVRLPVPALKERTADLPMLFGQMLATRCRAAARSPLQPSEEFLRAASEYAWPGNLRELAAVVDTLLALREDETELFAADWHNALAAQRVAEAEPLPTRMIKLDTVIQEHIYAVLNGCRGNKLRAAEVLGISRSTLYRMLDGVGQDASLSLAS